MKNILYTYGESNQEIFARFIDTVISEEKSTLSWMVAAYPDEESSKKIEKYVKKLDIDGDKKFKDYYHVTIRCWKDTSESLIPKVIEQLQKCEFEPIICDVEKLEILGKDDSLVLRFDNAGLSKLFKKVDSLVQDVDVPPSDYSSFKAHLTIVSEFSGKLPEKPDFKIKLSALKFVNDEEVLEEL